MNSICSTTAEEYQHQSKHQQLPSKREVGYISHEANNQYGGGILPKATYKQRSRLIVYRSLENFRVENIHL